MHILGEKAWFALTVKTRYEKRVSELLSKKENEVFLPLYLSTRTWSDRQKQVGEPLFPGYLFCRVDAQKRMEVLVTPGVIGFVGYGNSPSPIEDSEIDALKTLVSSRLPYERWPYLPVGQHVLIKNGPLTGMEGILIAHKKGYRILLSVNLLQRSVAVEVDVANVEPLNSGRRLSADLEALPPSRSAQGDRSWLRHERIS